MIKFFLFGLIAAIVEVILLKIIGKSYFDGKEDLNALSYTAHKDLQSTLTYSPGRHTYDEKSKRYVIEWRYEWEYQGKRHTRRYTDNPNNQWEHYMAYFPDEIQITINKKTGKYYVPKNVRARGYKYFRIMILAMIISYTIVYVLF